MDSLEMETQYNQAVSLVRELEKYKLALQELQKYLGYEAERSGNGEGMSEDSAVDILNSIEYDVASILKNPEKWIEKYGARLEN